MKSGHSATPSKRTYHLTMRRLFTAVSVLSLVACLALAALCVRSYWIGDTFTALSPNAIYSVDVEQGRIVLACEIDRGAHQWPRAPRRAFHASDRPPRRRWAVQFLYHNRRGASGNAGRLLVFPIWLLAVATAMVPACWLSALLWRRSRRKAGGCPRCGYNLTGNTSGVCPECGTPVLPSQVAGGGIGPEI
jgi:hypothetical protein